MSEASQSLSLILTPDQRLRVFVSSTLNELHAERLAVREAISALRLHPVMFETGAKPYPPRVVYRAFLEQSHIYVGIFGKSYGWIAPDMDISGLEDEYNLSATKRRLLYVKAAPEGRDQRLVNLLNRIESEAQISYKLFSTPEELREQVTEDISQLLSETFQLTIPSSIRGVPPVPTYLVELRKDMELRGTIPRQEVASRLSEAIINNGTLIVTGEPGVGKTYLLGTVGVELDAIYISLQNKSTQHVFSHLANHLSLRRNKTPENLPSENDAKSALQQEISNSKAILIIDDADQNSTVRKALMDLDPYNCRFVIASRQSVSPELANLPSFSVLGFSRQEISRFLKMHDISLGTAEMADLVTTSKGNPLYLYYFVSSRVSPNPQNLDAYQQALWNNLTPIQQEVLSFVAHTYFSLNTLHIHELLVSTTGQPSPLSETRQVLVSLQPLLRLTSEHYEVFHPYFADHIRSAAKQDGSAILYHEKLAELAASKQWDAAAAFHFTSAGNEKSKLFLLSGGSDAMLRGDWPLAGELLERLLSQTAATDSHSQAYIRYLLAQIYLETGRRTEARILADDSVRLFGQSGDTEWVATVEIWRTTLLIEEGQVEKAIDALEKSAEFYKNKDQWREAAAQLNLSLAYIRVSNFRRAASAAERALELFRKLEDMQGINTALLNLSASIGSLGDLDVAEKYANEMIQEARRHQLSRLECGALNHLARIQRQRKQPAAAQETLERCIAIARKIGSIEVEALNLANLGNAFRDQKKYGLAENAYLEALTLARQHKLRRQEGHALELLGQLRHEMGLTAEAITMLCDAIAIDIETGEHLRIASSYEKLAEIYEKSQEPRAAAEANESAGDHYFKTGIWSDAGRRLSEAAVHWCALGKVENALHCASRSIDAAMQSRDAELGDQLVLMLSTSKPPSDIIEYYLQLLSLILKDSEFSVASLILKIAGASRSTSDSQQRLGLKKAIELLMASFKTQPKPLLLSSLAIAFEQIESTLCGSEELTSLLESLCDKLDALCYQTLPDGSGVVTIGLNWNMPLIVQLFVISGDSILHPIAIAIALILLSAAKPLEDLISSLGGNREPGFSLWIITENSAEEEFAFRRPKYDTPRSLPASMLHNQKGGAALVIHADYETEADFSKHPENTALFWVAMNVLAKLVSYCTHTNFDTPALSKNISHICSSVLPFHYRGDPSP